METNQILIIGELIDQTISPATAQLMTVGKKLAAILNKTVHLIFLGGARLIGAESGFCYGADSVFTAADPHLDPYMAEPYLQTLKQVAEQLNPAIILFAHNDMGLELAPRLAFRLDTGAVLDCIELKSSVDGTDVEFIKPVYGGKAHAHFCIKASAPKIATIREGAFDPTPAHHSVSDEMGNRETIPLDIKIEQEKIKTVLQNKEIDESIAQALKLAHSEVVVCGGRGLKTAEGFDMIRETAELLNGAVAGSRPAIEYGWLSSTLQIGLTGKKVSPRLYFAIGISGALQHMAGCIKSKTIVAINTDESAQIFRFADYGIIGDYRGVLKGFNDEIRRINQQ